MSVATQRPQARYPCLRTHNHWGRRPEDPAEFDELLGGLRRDLAPVGTLEEMLVEKIAVCWWRQKRALKCEAGLVRRALVSDPARQLQESLNHTLGLPTNPELAAMKNHLSLPLGADLDRILRYETTIQRQLVYAINQLERLHSQRRARTSTAERSAPER